jgi:hypothetical protein
MISNLYDISAFPDEPHSLAREAGEKSGLEERLSWLKNPYAVSAQGLTCRVK